MSADALPAISADAAASADDNVLLDVREHDEWMSGHIPGAIHIPMGELMSRVGELDRGKRIVCICRSGGRSARITMWLGQQGFDAVNMTGGMHAWASGHHQVVSDAGNTGTVI